MTSKPKVTGFADVILVRTGENRLYHYENGVLAKTYTVATGTPQYPTPKGNFQIVLKRFRPTWVNPDPTGWGKSLPKSIPPGPGNPLGTRAMNLNSPGIRIHGTSNVRSLGTAGVARLHPHGHARGRGAVREVDSGTPVIIISGPPQGRPRPAAPSSATPTPPSTSKRADRSVPEVLELEGDAEVGRLERWMTACRSSRFLPDTRT